jgi:riboflavin kinase/FMN adenylyltransferase
VQALVEGQGPDGVWRPGVANLGKRPTVGKLQENFEVHLFDFAGDLYGQTLRVALVDFIRPEMKFAGLDALKAQIAADGEAARAILAA